MKGASVIRLKEAPAHVIDPTVLLVEDNPADARLVIEAFTRGEVRPRVIHVEDGDEALQFLHQAEHHVRQDLPDLILLDLNLPRKDGREVLGEIKRDDRLKEIPVIVLTTSNKEEDVRQSYQLHANSYIIKPFSLADSEKLIRLIEKFWLATVRLPRTA